MVETSIGEASQRRVRIATESQVDEAHTAFGHKIKTSGSTLSITFKSGVSVEIDIISPSAPAYPYVSKVSITGVDYLAAVGLCGNFNGVSADDVPPYQKGFSYHYDSSLFSEQRVSTLQSCNSGYNTGLGVPSCDIWVGFSLPSVPPTPPLPIDAITCPAGSHLAANPEDGCKWCVVGETFQPIRTIRQTCDEITQPACSALSRIEVHAPTASSDRVCTNTTTTTTSTTTTTTSTSLFV